MATRKPSAPVMLAIGAAHLTITTLTWRDLRRRPARLVRGKKLYWRIASGLNTTGSLAYFLFGRRPS
ncbi:MAG: hypothetical protein ACRDRN_15290 [Sciscionella sp.]